MKKLPFLAILLATGLSASPCKYLKFGTLESQIVSTPEKTYTRIGTCLKKSGSKAAFIAQFDATGKLSKSFNEKGPTPGIHFIEEKAETIGSSVAEDIDGFIMVSLLVKDSSGYQAQIIRLHPNGRRDYFFGNAGRLVTPVKGSMPFRTALRTNEYKHT